MNQQRHKRIVIEAPGRRSPRRERAYGQPANPRPRESVIAVTVIVAATLATFLALFITSRPYDPMNSTVEPQQTIPPGQAIMPSPKPSPSISPSPSLPSSGQTTESAAQASKPIIVDDATIEEGIEQALANDPVLAKLDVSTLVENGKVTVAGTVRSSELKQRVERTIRGIKGVLSVDNQLTVTEATP